MKKTKKTKGDHCFARCTVEPGMFRDEWLVLLEAIDPQENSRKIKVQLFADHRSVKEVAGTPKRREPVPALLKVSLMKRRGEFSQIVLPQPSVPIGPNLAMHNDDLVDDA